MTAKQYESLCRYFLAQAMKVPTSRIREGRIPGMSRLGRELNHQIDLYWISDDGLLKFYNIANAKWRSRKVHLGEVLLLQQVRSELHANKAVMITNTGFTKGALDHAEEKRIGLFILRPTFDYSGMEKKKPKKIDRQLATRAVTFDATKVLAAGNSPDRTPLKPAKKWRRFGRNTQAVVLKRADGGMTIIRSHRSAAYKTPSRNNPTDRVKPAAGNRPLPPRATRSR